MITFSQLGNYGRLGNQMYQIASTIGYAIKNSQDYGFSWKYASCFNSEKFNIADIITNSRIHEHDGLNYNELPIYQPNMGNIDMFGYFQSHKYFENCKSLILNEFRMKDITYTDYGFIHVRRGDYVLYPNHHPLIPVDYYRYGMDFFGKKKYYCLSDDISWCKENIIDDRLIFSENINVIDDLKIMVGCTCAIIANSSLSWWGAYLGNHDNVVCPKNWFGSAYSGFKIEDRIPKEWMII